MKQAIHIFCKDIRHLYPEILLVAIPAVLLFWRDAAWVEGLLLLAAGFLIARVIHAESIPGDRQFWITRPYRWKCLAAAKLLFILAFVNLPVFFAQFVIVLRDGFPLAATGPGLLWSQVLFFLCFSLPLAGLAAVTSSMLRFLFAALVLALAGLSIPQMIPPAIALAPSLPQWPEPVQWVRNSAVILALSVVLGIIVYQQYRSRRTRWSHVLAAGGLAGTALLYFYLPPKFGLGVQSRLSQSAFPGTALEISADARQAHFVPQKWTKWTDRVLVQVPLTVTSIPDGDTLKPDAITLSFAGPDGVVWKPQRSGSGVVGSGSGGIAHLQATAMMPPSFRRAAVNRPLTVRGSFYFTLFGRTRNWNIPLRETPVNVADGLQCYRGTFNQLYCRSIFRWPAHEVFAKVFQTDLHSFNSLISYSPFPAMLNLNPIETHWADGGPVSDTELTIVTREPLATIRRDFEIRGVQLNVE